MNWGHFAFWSVLFFVLFWVTGWPVTPNLKNVWGNHYNEKNIMYFTVLYFHYLLGILFFTFLFFGLMRNVIWKTKSVGNKQASFVLAYTFMVGSILAVLAVHFWMPEDENTGGGDTEVVDGSGSARAMSLDGFDDQGSP